MKKAVLDLRAIGAAVSLGAALCFGSSALGKPSILTVTVTPIPMTIARDFTVTVAASADVTQATAVVDFWKGSPEFLEVPLTRQGTNWVGSASVPLELRFDDPHKAEAKVRVLVLDAALRQEEQTVRVPVNVPTIAAAFSGGVLTISGDDQDNTIVASRDAAGTIVINGGAVPIAGDTPNVTNTTLIRIFGNGGNDMLQVSDLGGSMPPCNLLGGDGDDVLTGSNSADELDGGPGNDTLVGRGGNDHLIGGSGNDTLIGGQGQDQLEGGEGNDQFVWNPGDSNDVIEGQEGDDTLNFNGANIAENIDLSANAQRLRFFRSVASITMDCGGIEHVIFHAAGGADQIAVNDLTGTEVKDVIVDLQTANGTGDGQADAVIVSGTDTNDVIAVFGSTNGVSVLGLSAAVTVIGAEPALDGLVIDGRAGADVIDASGLEAGAINLTLNGGLGADTLIGSAGNDVLSGGRDNDSIFGRAGDDTIRWSPGDGSDVVEGEAGNDTLLFNGANIGEVIDISANGTRVRFSRNIGTVTMDCNEVETIQFVALGGSDVINVNDLSGTGVANVNLDLHATGGNTGDTLPDTVNVYGTTNDDAVVISGTSAGITVQGLSALVNIFGSEPALDQLVVRLLEGNDVANASALAADAIALLIDAGLGDDVLIGSAGADVLIGDQGDDVLIGGPGLDTLDGGSGSNILIQD